MKFADYHIAPEIKRSLEKLGFRRPTDIQYRAIPSVLKGEDVLAIAQTGTGKTAAFAIPVIHRIHEQKTSKKSFGVKCLVMVPTRELAIQINEVFENIGQFSKVKSYAITGGVDQDPQIEMLDEGMDIIVATPGRVFDLVSQGHLHLDKVQVLILDEADHMLDLGFYKDIRDLMRHLPRQRQTLFFSATINEKIKDLAYSIVRNPIRIQLSPKDPVSKNIEHAVAYIAMDDKRFFLERLIKENPDKKILVFVRTKVRAERVHKALERMSIGSLTIHGGREQDDRLAVMEAFKEGSSKILIATDVSARGIDVPHVDFVVNYDLPDVPENYVHRVGRTGRGIHKGKAYSFCSDEEKPVLAEIEKFLDKPIEVLTISKNDYLTTLDLTEDAKHDWKAAIAEAEAARLARGKKKGRKKK